MSRTLAHQAQALPGLAGMVWRLAPGECRRLLGWVLLGTVLEFLAVAALAHLAQPARLSLSQGYGALLALLGAFALAQLALLLAGLGQQAASEHAGRRVIKALWVDLHDRLVAADPALAEQLPVGAAEHASGPSLQQLALALPALALGVAAVLGLAAAALAASLAGGGWMLAVPLLAVGLGLLLRRPARQRLLPPMVRAAQRVQAAMETHWQGLKSIRGLGLHGYAGRRFARRLRQAQQWRALWLARQRRERLRAGLLAGLAVVGAGLLLPLFEGSGAGLAALLAFGWRFVARVGAVQAALSALAVAGQSRAEYEAVLATARAHAASRGEELPAWQTLRFRGLALRQGADGWRLPPVDGALHRGGWLAISGPSGSGKTSLIEVLAGLRRADAGSLWLDDRPLPPGAWRPRIAYAPQQPWVMADASLRANLRCGRAQDDAALAAALHQAGAGALAARLDEPAGRLSQGERQRLAIARALLEPADFLLLDEPSSALDEAAEAALLDSLRSLRGGRTLVTVSHRASLTAAADAVLVLPG